MSSKKIASSLSEQGRRDMANFLAANLSDKCLSQVLSVWENDVTFDIDDYQAGHLEIGRAYSNTGNPVVMFFREEQVVFDEIEIDY